MVTGDQPITAAAIARKVKILDEFVLTNVELEEMGVPPYEAIMRADAIVIHGDSITEATREDEALPESKKYPKFPY